MSALRRARFTDLDVATLYALLRLRVDVFVVEQACAYPELDGRDTEAGTWHCWLDDAGRLISYLRLLAEPAGATRLGRMATAVDRRGEGHASRLLGATLAGVEPPVVASVQAHLQGWYERFGFAAAGPGFVEDGIPHVPMVRA